MTSRHPKRTNRMLSTASLLLVMITLGLVSLAIAQSVEVSEPTVYNDTVYGLVVYVECIGTFPFGSYSRETWWIFSNRKLTVNSAVVDRTQRYTVYDSNSGGYKLYIINAVKEDAGIYQCQLQYDWSGLTYKSHKVDVIILIASYLPSINYPECSIAPSTTLIQGTEATFNCVVGESVPGVNLNLYLQRPDGTSILLGTETVTKVNVTFDDHNARFVCVMTSDTFPNARRTCSAGPIVIIFGLRYWTTDSPTRLGLLIVVQCTYFFSAGSTRAKLRWILNDAVMAENNDLIEADISRYSVNISRNDGFTLSRLIIRNAVKEDEGDYQCQAEYVQSEETQREMIQITVPIESYLPALNYPVCSIGTPSINVINETIFYNGTEATFNCTVGESVPNVNLELILQRSDGTTKELGNATTTKTITIDDNNATFFCFMTSDTFLTVNRSCAAGHITVLTSQIATTTSPMWPESTPTLPPTDSEGSSNYGSYSWLEKLAQGVTGGSISAGVLTFITVLIILKYRKSRAPRQSNPQTGQDQEAVSSVDQDEARASALHVYDEIDTDNQQASCDPTYQNTHTYETSML